MLVGFADLPKLCNHLQPTCHFILSKHVVVVVDLAIFIQLVTEPMKKNGNRLLDNENRIFHWKTTYAFAPIPCPRLEVRHITLSDLY